MLAWQLKDDLVSFLGLRVRMHRIGLSHWRAGVRLRSWGVAPLHRDGDTLHLPCADDEALWLGAWMDDDTASARLRLSDKSGACQAAITVPPAFQIAGLHQQDGSEHPLARAAAGARRDLMLHLECSQADATIHLALCSPDGWAALASRPAPARLTGPPPLPPRLG